MSAAKVSVICLCFNQGKFVQEAIDSVMSQTYPNVELIVVDDASNDDSADRIRECIARYPAIRFIALTENAGNCRAFNRGLAIASGEYLIDLAADDVLFPERVEKGVKALLQSGPAFGVNFSDAELIAEDGSFISHHSRRFPHQTIPQGDIYKDVIARFFICSPTVMFRRQVIESLGGYDESLAYEDFDFWIRSSRGFRYCYTPEPLVKKRIVKRSMSARQFEVFSRQQRSTYRVCEKIFQLNRNEEERDALEKRLFYEMRLSIRQLNWKLAVQYLRLLIRNRRARYQ